MGVLKAKVNGIWTPITQGYSAAQVGYVARAVVTAPQTVAASGTDITGLSVTFTAIPGHIYKTSWKMRVTKDATAGAVWTVLADAANNGIDQAFATMVASADINYTGFAIETGLSGATTRKMRLFMAAGQATVAAGATNPATLVVEDITQVQPYDQPLVEVATYTPVLTSLAPGTGGTPINTADYTFIGPPGLGSKGILNIQGRIAFGTSGQTFPTSASRVSLPPGFNHLMTATLWHVGLARGSVSGVYEGVTVNDTVATLLQFMFASTTSTSAGTPITFSSATATFPAAWAGGNEIRWTAQLNAVRV